MDPSRKVLQRVVIFATLMVVAGACDDQGGHAEPKAAKVEFSGGSSCPVGVFEAKGILGGRELVRLLPMIENSTSAELRARSASVDKASITPRAFGMQFYVLFTDAQVGTAFASHTDVYHLESIPEKIIIDETYYFCDGFLADNVLKVREKSRSMRCQVNDQEIARLLTQSEAVRNGTDCEAIYREMQFGWLGQLKAQGVKGELPTREHCWLAGPQRIDDACVNLERSPHFGNEVAVDFLKSN
jgi:hypothetical protein